VVSGVSDPKALAGHVGAPFLPMAWIRSQYNLLHASEAFKVRSTAVEGEVAENVITIWRKKSEKEQVKLQGLWKNLPEV
jgi:hypothetical protein